MELTYDLVPGGYRIYRDGALWIEQTFKPGVSGKVPMSPQEARDLAEALIGELTGGEA